MTIPALLGGIPVFADGPPCWPIPDVHVLRALQNAYADGSWGKYQGGSVAHLERRLADYHGVAFALGCASGTFAVELALRALKIGANDEVLMAGYDYGGNFLCIHALGAQPVLVDVVAGSWTLDLTRVQDAISPTTRAILASHLHGQIVPMRQLREVADRHGLPVIEDAAQVPGAMVQGRKAGAWGDVGILSFGGSKLLTAGRGGAILTSRPDVYQRARSFMHRGNLVCPLSELQAAVLLPQLDKLDDRNAVRGQSVRAIMGGLASIPGLRLLPEHLERTQPAYYKLGLLFDAAQFGLARDRFVTALRAEGVAMDEGFRALHVGRSPNRFRADGMLAESQRAHENVVVLHHPILLDEAKVDGLVAAMHKIHAHAPALSGKPGVSATGVNTLRPPVADDPGSL